MADNMEKTVGCVIMASGLGRRFGENKLLADFDGKPLIERILDTTNLSCITDRVVVTRSAFVSDFCMARGIPVILHTLPGKNDTIRLGLSHLLANHALSGCLFCTSDQPLLRAESIEALCLSFTERPDRIYRLRCGETAGNPVLFPKQFFPELLTLAHDQGGNVIVKKNPEQVTYVPTPDPYELYDVDTKEDLRFLLDLLVLRKNNV